MTNTFALLGSALMFLGVGAGAFGAHGLSSYFAQYIDLRGIYETAVRYHLIHALALFISAWLADRWPGALTTWAGWLFVVGILLFSGTLYLLVLTRLRWLGAITPIGGLAFLAGWACLFMAAWRS